MSLSESYVDHLTILLSLRIQNGHTYEVRLTRWSVVRHSSGCCQRVSLSKSERVSPEAGVDVFVFYEVVDKLVDHSWTLDVWSLPRSSAVPMADAAISTATGHLLFQPPVSVPTRKERRPILHNQPAVSSIGRLHPRPGQCRGLSGRLRAVLLASASLLLFVSQYLTPPIATLIVLF